MKAKGNRRAMLAEVRSTLAPDEALLSFQIAPDEGWFGTGRPSSLGR